MNDGDAVTATASPANGPITEMPTDAQCKCPKCSKVSVQAAGGPNQWRRYCPVCDGHFRAGDRVLTPRKKTLGSIAAEFPSTIPALQEAAGHRDPAEVQPAPAVTVTLMEGIFDPAQKVSLADFASPGPGVGAVDPCSTLPETITAGMCTPASAPVPMICTFPGCEERALSAGTGAMSGEYRCGPHFRELSKEFQALMQAVSDTYLEKLGAEVDATFEVEDVDGDDGPKPAGSLEQRLTTDVLRGHPRYIQDAVHRAVSDIYLLVESGQWQAGEGQSMTSIVLKAIVDALALNRANYESRAKEQEQTVKRLETQLELSQRARRTAEEAFLGLKGKLDAIDKVLFASKLSYEPDRAEAISAILGAHESSVNEMQGELQKHRENAKTKPAEPRLPESRVIRLGLAEQIFIELIRGERVTFAEPSSFERKARCAFQAADAFLLEECTIRKGGA